MACLLSIRCWANFDLLLLYLKSRACSWNLTLNSLHVCPVYFISHSGHVSWYTLLLSYLFWGTSCFTARRFPIVLLVVKAIFTFVLLNNFAINLVSLPTFVFGCFVFVFSLCWTFLWKRHGTYCWLKSVVNCHSLSVCFQGSAYTFSPYCSSTWLQLFGVHWGGMSHWVLWCQWL